MAATARKIIVASAAIGLTAIGIAALPQPAQAQYQPYGWYNPYAPQVYYTAPQTYYAPPPSYYAPPPARVWIPGHWRQGYWVPGRWS